MIFKTITDETTLSGQRIVGALQARKIAQQQATAQLEIDIACLKEYQVACQNGTVTTEQFDVIMHKASASAVEYSAKVKAGTGTVQSYANAQRATNSALQEVSIGAGIASKAVKLFSTALNMIAFTAIIQGISWLIGKVDEWIVTAKEAKESANAFKESLSTFFNETQANLKTISSLSDRFDELSKNVDNNGKKVGGTEEEYAEFLDICQQVGQIMPELITGYTAEGEAIITLQGKVDGLTDSYKEAIKAKAALFISKGDEEGNTIESFFEDYDNFINGTQKGWFSFSPSPQFSKTTKYEEYYGYDQIHEWLSNVNGKTLEELNNQIKSTTGQIQNVYLRKVLEEAEFDINNITEENYNAVHDVLNNKLIVMEKELSDRVINIRSAFQNMLYADSDYWHIDDENVLSAINSLYGSIDAEFIKNNELFSQKALQTFESDFVSLFNNDATKQAMVDFHTPIADDETVEDYADRIKSSLETVQSYCDENGITIPINFDDTEQTINNLEAQYQRAVDFAKDKFDGYDPTEFFKEHSINTQEEIDAWQEIAQRARDAAEAEKEYLNQTPKESPTLFNQLTSSQESLDKFQSSVKSAADAYTTLLSGNYSTSELLDSIQTINQAVTDMGGSLDWEFIANQSQMDSLELLGGAIEHISQEYAESILSGAGININSEFGQMLAKMVQEAYEAEAEFAGMNAQLDDLQSSYQTLAGILESYNETGYISLDNLQSLLTADENLIAMLEVENGQLSINQEAYENLVAVQLLEFKTKLNEAAAAEIEALAKAKSEEATNKNAEASQNAVEKLDAETAAFGRNTTAAIANAVAKAEESGVSEEEIQGIFDKYTAIWDTAMDSYNTDFSGFMGGGESAASNAGSKAADTYLEAFQKEYDHLKELLDRGEISEAQYLNRLRSLYTRYFKDRKEYLDEYKKYESEYLSGMLDLHNKALSGISTLLDQKINAANDAKDASISALEEEKEAAAEAFQTQIDAIEEEKDAIDDLIKEKEKKIDALNEEVDAIQKAAETRKKNINLQKEEYNLERMLNQRTTAVYKEGEGFVFEADTTGIHDARESVKEAKEELEIDRLQREADLIQKEIDLLEEKKDALTEQQEAIQKMLDESNKYYDNLIKQQEKMWDSMIKGMEQQKSKWEELADIQQFAEAYSAVQQVFGELGYSVEDVLNGSGSAFEDFKSRYISIMSDLNQNISFQDGLEYASGVAKEKFGSIISDAQGTVQQLSQTFSDGTFSDAISKGVSDGIISAQQELDKMDQLGKDAGDGFIEGWKERETEISDATKQTAKDAVDAFAEGQDSHSPSKRYEGLAVDAIEGLLFGVEENKRSFIDTIRSLAEEGVLAFEEGFNFEDSTLNTSFDALKLLIESVTEALGFGTDEPIGGLLGALTQLSDLSFSEEGILTQFNNLKAAIDSVSSAINGGGGSSDGEGASGGKSITGTFKGGKQAKKGSEGGGGNSLTGAIESIGETASEVIGEPDAEGDGTVIGEFGSLETAVNDVTAAIGGGAPESGEGQDEEGSDNLSDSITDLGETTKEILGEPDGEGVIGRFGQFRNVIGEANKQIRGIYRGLRDINGYTAECTIRITVEGDGYLTYASGTAFGATNSKSTEYNAKYKGNAHVSGTANVTGNWGVRKPGRSLVGELGQEIWIHSANGTFETVGDNGPEWINTARGDLIFNHLQTKELLDRGNIVKTGKAYADGNIQYTDGTVIRPNGEALRPLQPGSREFDLMRAFEPLVERIQNGQEELWNNAMFEGQRQFERWTKEMTNNTAINNVTNNRNMPPVVNHINVTCPGVTEQQVAERLGNVIGQELNKQFNGFSLYTDQMSRRR